MKSNHVCTECGNSCESPYFLGKSAICEDCFPYALRQWTLSLEYREDEDEDCDEMDEMEDIDG